ncbi:MAG: cytoplasmic protein [Verrucomicrobiales bacterium]|nr:cytoplasmic protein [Verrucomicrobiales bacterium]
MTGNLEERLNQIPARITSEGFLRSTGIGNEVAFHIFDYPPDAELKIRDYLSFLGPHLAKAHPELKVAHLNLFELFIKSLQTRGFLQRAYDKQKRDGDVALIKTLAPQFEGAKLADAFAAEVGGGAHDLVLVSGVGSVFPVVRTHSLLAALQPRMGRTPLVMFYPGTYDGQYVRLFGKLKGPYYRAFKLVP